MSYILEALRKAERERQHGEAPTRLEVLSIQPAQRRNGWLWLAAAMFLLNLGILGYFWVIGGWHGKPPANATGPTPSTLEGKDAAKAGLGPGQANEGKAADLHRPRANNAVELRPKVPSPNGGGLGWGRDKSEASPSFDRPPPNLPSVGGRVNSTALLREGPTVGLNPAASAQPTPPQARTPPVTHETMPLEAGKSARPNKLQDTGHATGQATQNPPFDESTARLNSQALLRKDARLPATGNDRPKGSDAEPVGGVPLLDEMPEEVKRSIPNLKINVLAYSSVPEERFAVINMVKYNKGEPIPGGAILRDVQTNGLVLELNGKRFWVSHR